MQIMNLTPHLQKPPRTARTLGESRLRPAQRVPEDVVEDAQHRRYGTRHGLRGQPRGSAKAVERTRGRYGGACTSMVARRAVAAMAPPSGGAAGARWLPRWTFQSAPSGAAIDGEYPLPGAGCRTVDGDDQSTGVDRAQSAEMKKTSARVQETSMGTCRGSAGNAGHSTPTAPHPAGTTKESAGTAAVSAGSSRHLAPRHR